MNRLHLYTAGVARARLRISKPSRLTLIRFNRRRPDSSGSPQIRSPASCKATNRRA